MIVLFLHDLKSGESLETCSGNCNHPWYDEGLKALSGHESGVVQTHSVYTDVERDVGAFRQDSRPGHKIT